MDWDFIADPVTGELTIGKVGDDPNKLNLSTDLTEAPVVEQSVTENKPVTQTQASPELVALQNQINQLTTGLNTITQFLTGQINTTEQPKTPEYTMEDDVANSLFPDNAETGKKFMKNVVDNVTRVIDDKLKEFKNIAAPITVQHSVEQEFRNTASKYGQDFVNHIPVMQHILSQFPELNMTSEQAYLKAKSLYPNYKPQQQQPLQQGQVRTHQGVRELPDRINSNAGEELHKKPIKTIEDAIGVTMQELGMIS